MLPIILSLNKIHNSLIGKYNFNNSRPFMASNNVSVQHKQILKIFSVPAHQATIMN